VSLHFNHHRRLPIHSNSTLVLLFCQQHLQPNSTPVQPLTPTSIPHSAPDPPSYTLYVTQHNPSSSFISPYTSNLTPSSAYLSDPLNAWQDSAYPKLSCTSLVLLLLTSPSMPVYHVHKAATLAMAVIPTPSLRPVICDSKGEDTSLRYGLFAKLFWLGSATITLVFTNSQP
jgi:hypothetical protein